MAKPTKTAPKRTNKSKTKKGKLDFLTNRINFKSRKTQFILTILVFALVGGAWFTYKSFAATATATWAPEGTAVWVQDLGGCKTQNINDMAKNNIKVWNVACPPLSVNATIRPLTDISAKSPVFLGVGKYRACSMVKGSGNIKVEISSTVTDGTSPYAGLGPSSGVFTVVNDGQYHEYCTGQIPASKEYHAPRASIKVEAGSWVNIQYIQLQYLGGDSNSSKPTPKK